MMSICRAAVLREPELGKKGQSGARFKPLQIEEIEVAAPGSHELLIKVLAAGLCHSDLSVMNGSRPRPLPMLLGHEACGEISALGDGVDRFVVGDRVVFSFVPSCGHCLFCAGGRPSLCQRAAESNGIGSLLSGERRFKDKNGYALNHHLGVSAFSELTVVSDCSAVKVDKDLAPEIAALFGCAVLTGVGAVINTAKVPVGQSVIIFGMGGVGLAALLGAVAAGAYPVVCVDIVESKLEMAQTLGATHVINSIGLSTEDTVEAVKKITSGGAAYVFETVGNEQALNQAYLSTARGGTTVAVGLPHPSKQFSISAASLVAEERTVKGSYMGSSVPIADIPRLIALYRSGQLPVEKLISARLTLDQINYGFEQLDQGAAIRQIVLF
jgi:Zn-dependent alcohol dehydrogenase